VQGLSAARILGILGWLAALLYVGVGVLELVLDDEETIARRFAFFAVLCGLALLVMVGIRMLPRRPWPGVAVASVGAILGGFALFWTGLAILLAIGIVMLSILSARRVSVAPA
jgi:hypothetical protein